MRKRWMVGVVILCIGVTGMLNAAEEATAKTTTLGNLQTAYGSEVTAKARYEAFAAKADAEGFKSVAVLFCAAAESESIHIVKHEAAIKAMGGAVKALEVKAPEVKSTKENLEESLKGVGGKRETVYAAFVKQAETDKADVKAVRSFQGAMAAEASLFKLFQQALDGLDGWKAAGKEVLVCDVCGWTTLDTAVKQCPICQAPRTKFESFK